MKLKLWFLICCLVSLNPVFAGQLLSLQDLGQREYRMGHYAAAESYFRSALEKTSPDSPERAAVLSDLGTVLLDEEWLPEAQEKFAQALTIRRRGSDAIATAAIMRHLAAVYSIQRRDEEAIELLNQALKKTKGTAADPALTANILNSLGVAYFRQARLNKAEDLFKQGLQLLGSEGAKFEFYAAPLLNNLGAVYCQKGSLRLAEDFMIRSIKLTTNEFGPTHPALADSLDGLGVVYSKMKRYADAEAQYQRAIEIFKAQGGTRFDVPIARSIQGLGETYLQQGNLEKAAAVLEDAVRIARPNLLTNLDMVSIVDAYARVLQKLGKTTEAKDLRSEAQRARVTLASTVRAYQQD